ncbi:signal peptidase I [Peribacillus simplex]|uniref:signal peptidase I n=1 Tax=Peribacillus simplex TaxID=1478 RepID=UPI003D2BB67C
MKNKEFFSWIKAIVIAGVLAFTIRTYIFAPIVVDGESMMPTLEDHERIILNKYGTKINDIQRFDIVVFHATKEKDYIKRVIGLPGDHIEFRNDTLYINGKKYEEAYLNKPKSEFEKMDQVFTLDFKLEDYTGDTIVPENELFVMGDNRRKSWDSREIGTISIDEVKGKAKLVFWPIKDIEILR